MTKEFLYDLLVRPGHVQEADFAAVADNASKSGKTIEELVIEKGYLRDEQLGQLVANALGFPFVNLREEKIAEDILHTVPELVARTKQAVAFARVPEGVRVAMADPADLEVVAMLQKRFESPVIRFYATPSDIRESCARYKTGLAEEFSKTIKGLSDAAAGQEAHDEAVVHAVETLLEYGYESKASDIHIEPHAGSAVIRFRIDGVMHDVLSMPLEHLDLITTRIKILAKLRTDEHRAAQDGKLVFGADAEKVDVRVSIVPVTEGENIVMRILSAKSRQFSLTDLGLAEKDYERVLRAIENPHGMILVTGPTGSGKTTTVYGMLKVLNTRDVHIATIEDPVEYEIEGISQIQVNTRTNLTFAKGLRAIVRQDPDIIMVGEIRDEETAGIAVNSAMTGHLVLSTLHANDAATTLPRLLDMGIEPFLVASTVNVIIAQRLVRKICEKCRTSYEITETEEKLLDSHPHIKDLLKPKKGKARLYRGAGCKVCSATGYAGRVGIFEVLTVSEDIKSLIANRAAAHDIIAAARRDGMTTMMEDGVAKVLTGLTTLDEVVRATME